MLLTVGEKKRGSRTRVRLGPFGQTLAGALLAGLAGLAGASAPRAQVLQIGPEGGLETFSGPRVFTSEGSRPITAAKVRGGAPRRAFRISAPPSGGTQDAFSRAAAASRLSSELLAAVAWRESRFQPRAVSKAGAVGEMQLMPATARALRVDPTDRSQNIAGGASYLGALLRRYDGDLMKALAAYNAGPAAVDRYHGVPPYRETQAYVAAVLDRLSQVVVPVASSRGAGR